MAYHLQYLRDNGDWHTIEASDDLSCLTQRRQRMRCVIDGARLRIVDAPPRDASAALTLIALALVFMLIGVICMSCA